MKERKLVLKKYQNVLGQKRIQFLYEALQLKNINIAPTKISTDK